MWQADFSMNNPWQTMNTCNIDHRVMVHSFVNNNVSLFFFDRGRAISWQSDFLLERKVRLSNLIERQGGSTSMMD